MRNAKKALMMTAAVSGLAIAGAGTAAADAGTIGSSSHSPGVVSGNTIQVPINIPINVCGISANLGGALNPAAGNVCINSSHKLRPHFSRGGNRSNGLGAAPGGLGGPLGSLGGLL